MVQWLCSGVGEIVESSYAERMQPVIAQPDRLFS